MALKKVLVSIRIPEEMNKELTQLVEPLGLSKNAFIIGLIHKALKKKAPPVTQTKHQMTNNDVRV